MPAKICEVPSFCPIREWPLPTFGLPNLGVSMQVGVRFGTWRDYDQYYMMEISTIFYDYFLILADEVSHWCFPSLDPSPLLWGIEYTWLGGNHGVRRRHHFLCGIH